FLIESTAASRLTTTPRLIPFDSATPRPTISRRSPSRISATTAVTFQVPTSRPTRYRSLRATGIPHAQPPALPPFCRLHRRPAATRHVHGPHVDAVVEPQVDVVDVGDPFVERLREV